MHQAWDSNNRLVVSEVVRAEIEEALTAKLELLHKRDIHNPKISRITQTKVGRNDTCPCGSGVKV